MKKIISLFSLILIFASSTVMANQSTVTELKAAGVTLSATQEATIRAAEGDDALIQAIADLVKAKSADRLEVKAIITAAVAAHPNLIVAITEYAIAAAPSVRDIICTTAITQTRGTAIQGRLTQQGTGCSRFAY